MTTADDALENAASVEWQEIIIVGYDETGMMRAISSNVEMSSAIALLEALKFQLLSGLIPKYDA